MFFVGLVVIRAEVVCDAGDLIWVLWAMCFVCGELCFVELLRGWYNIPFSAVWVGFVCSWFWVLVLCFCCLVFVCFDLIATCLAWLHLIAVVDLYFTMFALGFCE